MPLENCSWNKIFSDLGASSSLMYFIKDRVLVHGGASWCRLTITLLITNYASSYFPQVLLAPYQFTIMKVIHLLVFEQLVSSTRR
jgi:hypothetical protein